MFTRNYAPDSDPMPAGLIDRMLSAVHAEIDTQTQQ